MKKLLSIFLTLAMLVSALTVFSAVAPASAAVTTLGDLNNDGAINAKDSLLLRKYIATLTSSGLNTAAADVNGDGNINMADSLKLRMFCSGAISSFDAEAGCSTKELTIAGNDISEYDIVSMKPAEGYYAGECYSFGVRNFRNLVSDACGYTLSITGTSGSGLDSNGRFPGEDSYGGNYLTSNKQHHIYMIWEVDTELGQQGYNWRVDENGDLYIRGGDRTGILNASYEFAYEYLGYRYFAYDNDYFFPQELSNVPAGLDFTYVPQITYRDVHTAEWIKENGGDGTVEILCAANHINSHDDRAYNERAKFGFGKGNVWVHAHSFEYIYGISNQEQPCLSNSGNRETALSWVKNLLDERVSWGGKIGYNLTRVSVSWNDNTNYCCCSSCCATYIREQSVAGTLVPFNNYIAQSIQNQGYDVHIYNVAYGPARIPPKYARPNEYCDISYCWNGCNNHLFNSMDCDEYGDTKGFVNWKEQYYFEFWAKITDNLEGWYYATNFAWNIGACPNVLNIREDFRYWAEQGVTSIYAEAEGDAIYNFEALRNYVMARCMWDPYMSEAEFQQIIDEFLQYWYGDGWRYIKEYLYMNDEAGNLNGCFTNNYDWPGDMHNVKYYYDNYNTMLDLFNNALALAKNDTCDQTMHIKTLSVQMYWMACTGAIVTAGSNAIVNNAALSEGYDNMYNIIRTYGYVASIYGVPDSSGYNKNASPMVSWLDLVNDGRWITWYNSVGRTLPRDNPNDPEVVFFYLDSQPTKTHNPLADWEP